MNAAAITAEITTAAAQADTTNYIETRMWRMVTRQIEKLGTDATLADIKKILDEEMEWSLEGIDSLTKGPTGIMCSGKGERDDEEIAGYGAFITAANTIWKKI